MGPLTKLILESEGYPVTQDGLLSLLEVASSDSVSPGICRACHVVHSEVEPDARDNYCDDCGETKVVSLLVLQRIL